MLACIILMCILKKKKKEKKTDKAASLLNMQFSYLNLRHAAIQHWMP